MKQFGISGEKFLHELIKRKCCNRDTLIYTMSEEEKTETLTAALQHIDSLKKK